MNSTDWWQLLAGIALFIFAMALLEDALKELAGRQFKKFLQRQTSNKVRAIAGGAVVTAVLQSSSIVLLMVLSFVGAGVMTMRNALAVTFGANLGTTLSGWIVAILGFKIGLDAISYPLLVFALAIKMAFPANSNIKNLTHFIFGFGLLFIGLEWMKASVTGLVTNVDISRYAHLSPYLFILIGLVVTAIIQSSSAMVAIALTALFHRVIPFESAACVVIGSELGTTIKILIGSIGGTPDKKRVSLGNFIFNIAIALIATLFMYPLINIIRNRAHINDPLLALVAFQTCINVIGIVVFYPFIGKFATLLERLFKNGNGETAKYIHKGEKHFEQTTLIAAEKETRRLMQHTIRLNTRMLEIGEAYVHQDKWQAIRAFAFEKTSPDDEYKNLKQLYGEILDFLVDAHAANMSPGEIEKAGKLITISRHIMHAAKNIKDIQHNIKEMGASDNDLLNEFFVGMRDRERAFYEALGKMMGQGEEQGKGAVYEPMREQVEPDYQSNVDSTLDLLNKDKISEMDSSTLLNMHREIYSSHKALLKAVALFGELVVEGKGQK